jgi:flagellar basal-body rod protein FlgB
MSIGNDLTTEAVRMAMSMQELRAEVATRNIASANLPGAAATRLDFGSSQGLLERTVLPTMSDESGVRAALEAARSSPLASESVDPEGTGINVDEEVANLASASAQYLTLTESLSRHMGLMRLAITGRN